MRTVQLPNTRVLTKGLKRTIYFFLLRYWQLNQKLPTDREVFERLSNLNYSPNYVKKVFKEAKDDAQEVIDWADFSKLLEAGLIAPGVSLADWKKS